MLSAIKAEDRVLAATKVETHSSRKVLLEPNRQLPKLPAFAQVGDPMRLDKTAMEWAGAWMSHKTPAAGKVGFVYMLAGGTDASNTDPYAAKPSAKITGSRPDRTS